MKHSRLCVASCLLLGLAVCTNMIAGGTLSEQQMQRTIQRWADDEWKTDTPFSLGHKQDIMHYSVENFQPPFTEGGVSRMRFELRVTMRLGHEMDPMGFSKPTDCSFWPTAEFRLSDNGSWYMELYGEANPMTVACFGWVKTKGPFKVDLPSATSPQTRPEPRAALPSSAQEQVLRMAKERFDLAGTWGDRKVVNLHIAQPGRIAITAEWQRANAPVALILNGPGQRGYYTRRDGLSPLYAEYTVTSENIALGNEWTVTVANFSRVQDLHGIMLVEFHPF